MTGKIRLRASIDAELLAHAKRSVAAGDAASLSAWVNEALRAKIEHDRRLAAGADFIADYEARHGVITDEDIELAQQEARRRSVTVRPSRSKPRRSNRS